MKTASILAIAFLLSVPAILGAGESGSLLGSTAFKPAPDHPVGFRGDYTGRFPGATPPLQWSRRAKGITAGIKYQAKKPSGDSTADAQPMEYFTVKDWLVTGPFDGGIEKDCLGGEAAVQPDTGAKAGEHTWKPYHVGMDTVSGHAHNNGICRWDNVDFVYCFGKFGTAESGYASVEGDFKDKVAYAHSWLYSASAGKTELQVFWDGAAVKVWLNGNDVPLKGMKGIYGQKADIQLKKGWNRLLVKLASGEGITRSAKDSYHSRWRFTVYMMPEIPVSYETKNIQWMTMLTGRSMSQPIVVGDRIFVGSGMSDLICLNKADGKILWIRSSTQIDGLPPEEQKALREKFGAKIAQLEKLNDEVVRAVNASVSAQGPSADRQAELEAKMKEKYNFERDIQNEIEAVDKKKYPAAYRNENTATAPTPVSDGKLVWGVSGGACKTLGAVVVTCFDLSGKRIWGHLVPTFTAEHGNHISPILLQGKCIVGVFDRLIAWDAETGTPAWDSKFSSPGSKFCGQNPVPVKIGRETGVFSVAVRQYFTSVSNGATFEAGKRAGNGALGDASPIIEDGVYYDPHQKDWGGRPHFRAFDIKGGSIADAKCALAWELDDKDIGLAVRPTFEGGHYVIASPLYVNGLVYAVNMAGGMLVVDIKAKKTVTVRFLDGYTRYDRTVFGLCASPTLGGKNIFITDNSGYTTVIEPGPAGKDVAHNAIENVAGWVAGQVPATRQECFYTAPTFEGGRIYLHGDQYLYCIGEK